MKVSVCWRWMLRLADAWGSVDMALTSMVAKFVGWLVEIRCQWVGISSRSLVTPVNMTWKVSRDKNSDINSVKGDSGAVIKPRISHMMPPVNESCWFILLSASKCESVKSVKIDSQMACLSVYLKCDVARFTYGIILMCIFVARNCNPRVSLWLWSKGKSELKLFGAVSVQGNPGQ